MAKEQVILDRLGSVDTIEGGIYRFGRADRVLEPTISAGALI